MSKYFVALIASVSGVFLSAMIIAGFDSSQIGQEAIMALSECQAELPRNQTCVIVAIPKDTAND